MYYTMLRSPLPRMMAPVLRVLCCLVIALLPSLGHAQCGPGVPTHIVDLSYDPNATYLSPLGVRNDNCCGTIAPDRCVLFIITLHPLAEGIIFDICDGAVPSGAMYYQVNCGPPVAVGEPLCLNGTGPFELTFCKPGNNPNAYCITSVAEPGVGPDISINDGCSGSLHAYGYDPSTIVWTSVFPGIPGQFDSYMNCNTCEDVLVNWQPGAPAYVDYQVCGFPLGGCTPMAECDTVRVTFNPSLAAVIQPPFPTVCYGGSGTTITAIGSGGTPPYTYLWNTGDTTASIFVGPGSYSVVLGDTSGCPPTSSSITVTAFLQPITASAGPDQVICDQTGTVSLNGAVTGASGGMWTGPGQFQAAPDSLNVLYTPTPLELQNGQSILVLQTTGNGGCPGDADTVMVSWMGIDPNASLSGTDVTCFGGADGSASFQPALSGYSFQWNDPASQTTATAAGLTAGIYQVSVTDSLGCDTVLTVQIAEPPPLLIDSIAGVDAFCNGQANATASAYVSGGTPGYVFLWNDPNAQTGTTATMLAAGSYSVSVTDQHGCSTTAGITLDEPPPISVSIPPVDPVCVNAPFTVTASGSGGNGGLAFFWPGFGNGASITTSLTGPGFMIVEVTDSLGCPGPSAQVFIEVIDLFSESLTAWGDTLLCAGDPVQFGAVFSGDLGAVSMDWPDIGASGPGPFILTMNTSMELPVVVMDVCNNMLTDTVSVVVEVPPVIDLPAVLAEGCAPLEVQFPSVQGTTPLNYQWYLGDGSVVQMDAPTHVYGAGNYQVYLVTTTPGGCTSNSGTPSQVNVFNGPTAAMMASPWSTDIESPQVQFTDVSNGIITQRLWTFPDGSTSNQVTTAHFFNAVGTHAVQLWVRDVNQCEDVDVRNIVITPIHDLDIPNAFSPNPNGSGGGYYDPNDLSNDVFYPFAKYVDEFKMRIYNRWGELVFESTDIGFGWDGFYKGHLSPQDVYTYRVWLKFMDGVEVDRMGDVTLFR